MYIPKKVQQRLLKEVKKFQRILINAKTKDINESDTSLVITDMLSDMFGYDKYSEITTETAIRGTYCDLAVVLTGTIRLLIEAKAIGLDLKDSFVKQAIDYAANKGIDWVILTNGYIWEIYKVSFTKPIDKKLIATINMLEINPKNNTDLELLFILSKEGLSKSSLPEYYNQKQATDKFLIGRLLTSEDIIKSVKRKLRKLYPNIRVEEVEIEECIVKNICRREIFESDEAKSAQKIATKLNRK